MLLLMHSLLWFYNRWSPDSRHILTTSDFQLRLTVWSLVSTACVHVPWPKHGSKAVAFTKDGMFAAIATRRDCKDYINMLACRGWEAMGPSVPTLWIWQIWNGRPLIAT